jgi:hypothetical protein
LNCQNAECKITALQEYLLIGKHNELADASC